ncbi:MAG TPA: hypothetical protein VHZ07_25445 [Bryobacteraceae bacterium]|jgi:hypothetical protein|nr:hypothetical protein [Bryobacteraceae bacterium]
MFSLRKLWPNFVLLTTAIVHASATQKIVYYSPYQGATLMKLLADDSGPRALLVPSIYQNFKALSAVGANTVVIRCDEEGSYVGEEGGGFPYNPASSGLEYQPQMAIAQEIIVSLADAAGLKVIFLIYPSFYHENITQTEPGIGAVDMKNYIQSIIDPGSFYPASQTSTTQLSLVGLRDHNITENYAADGRVYGFIFPVEYAFPTFDPSWYSQQLTFMNTYWPFFYSLCHTGGNSKAIMYISSFPCQSGTNAGSLGPCSDGSNPYANIKGVKSYFAQYQPDAKPDLMGFEWYGPGPQWEDTIANTISLQISALTGVDPAYPYDYSVPISNIWMAEGGLASAPASQALAVTYYYQNALMAAHNQGLSAMAVWSSLDTWENYMNGFPYSIPGPGGAALVNPVLDFDVLQRPFALFSATIGQQITRYYPCSPEGYWIPNYGDPNASWTDVSGYTQYSTAYGATAGAITYEQPNPQGKGVRAAFTSFQ